MTEVKQFQAQFRFSKLVFLLTLLIILTVNLIISYVEFFSKDEENEGNYLVGEINSMSMFLQSLAFLIIFSILGTNVAIDIKKYYEKRYNA